MARPVLAGNPWLQRLVFRLAFKFARTCPPWLARLLTHFVLSTFIWLLDGRGRKTVRRNLTHFVPGRCPEALARMTWRSYAAFCRYVYDNLRMDLLTADEVGDQQVTLVDPWGVFRHAPLSGPAIIAIVHCNWELTAAVLHRRGLTAGLEGLVLSSGDRHIDALYERVRNAVQARSLWLGHAPLAALKALKAGKVLLVAADRDYSRSGHVITFAGEPMAIPRGPAALAVQTGAPIIPVLLARDAPSHFMLIVAKPIHALPGLSKNQQVDRLTKTLVQTMERFIAAAPSQWIAFHNAWRTQETPAHALEIPPLGKAAKDPVRPAPCDVEKQAVPK